jgi:hypothetical protein
MCIPLLVYYSTRILSTSCLANNGSAVHLKRIESCAVSASRRYQLPSSWLRICAEFEYSQSLLSADITNDGWNNGSVKYMKTRVFVLCSTGRQIKRKRKYGKFALGSSLASHGRRNRSTRYSWTLKPSQNGKPQHSLSTCLHTESSRLLGIEMRK